MTILRCEHTGNKFLIEQPGLLAFDPGGGLSHEGFSGCETPGFLVTPPGDFVVSQPFAVEAEAHLTIGGRQPLGRLEMVQDGQVISAERSDVTRIARFLYSRQGRPIAFNLPPTARARCAYSATPLGGLVTIRCTACFKLYAESIWAAELAERCPACGWSEEEEEEDE